MVQEYLTRYFVLAQTNGPMFIQCDSQAAIGRARSVMYDSKYHRIRRRHISVRQLLSSGVITIDYFFNVSYPPTKGLTRKRVERSSAEMGL